MTGNTHRIIALRAMESFCLKHKQIGDFVKGNVMADYIPYYKYKQHYPKQSMEYVLDNNKTVDNLFELGILSHFVSDFLCTPHFNNWRLYSSKAIKHIKFEKKLEKVALGFNFGSVDVKRIKRECINDKVLKLYNSAGESYEDNMKAAYSAVVLMLDNFVKV